MMTFIRDYETYCFFIAGTNIYINKVLQALLLAGILKPILTFVRINRLNLRITFNSIFSSVTIQIFLL